MKNLFLIVALFSIFFCNSQVTNTNVENTNTYYFNEAIEKPATFPGGIEAFEKFFKENFVVTDKVPSFRDPIKILMEFIVEKDGTLSAMRITRHFGFDSKKEGLRVLSKSPKWIPGMEGGKIVRSKCEIFCFI